jgi:hypothetical protein
MHIIDFPKTNIKDLSGRTLMLNLEKVRRFQCANFALSFNTSTAVVPPNASMEHLNRALSEGILIDVTDQAKSGLLIGGTKHSKVDVNDTGKRVFMGTDQFGNKFIVAPKTKEEEQAFEKEIAETGTIKVEYEKAAELTRIELQPLSPVTIYEE